VEPEGGSHLESPWSGRFDGTFHVRLVGGTFWWDADINSFSDVLVLVK